MYKIGGIFSLMLSFCYLSGQDFILNTKTYQRHSELTWQFGNTSVEYFRIRKSEDGVLFQDRAVVNEPFYLDFTSSNSLDDYYLTVEALNGLQQVVGKSDTIHIQEHTMIDEELLDMVQAYSFRYFWDFGHPSSGMARERNTSGDIVTTGGTGFGVMAILVGIENGYISRQQGLNRLIKIVSFLQFADRFHGVFPHWLNGVNGNVYPFSEFDNGGDLVETAFLMEGLLTARAFFNEPTPSEDALRKIIKKLWEDVEWDFYSKNNSGVLLWHWSPDNAWKINHHIRGYNEALIIYLLAISSPTHSVSPSYWKTGWAGSGYKNGYNYYGIKLPVGPAYGGPLFFAHYSYMGFDPRYIKDEFTNYFTQNVNHTLINREYCIKNPLNFKEYSAQCWGLTASDDPNGYLAHEPLIGRDNGTISPTAALSSMPYTPNESLDALKYFYFVQGDKLLGKYGFYDAFNPTKNWYANSYLAIDQGPIVCMLQNYRTELLWKNFMQNEEILDGLDKIGFVPDGINVTDNSNQERFTLSPNPFKNEMIISSHDTPELKVSIYDTQGVLRETKTGSQTVLIGSNLNIGMYIVQIETGGTKQIFRILKI